MKIAIKPAPSARTIRLTVLVNPAEAAEITRQAAAVGRSVSAWLRDHALEAEGSAGDDAIIRQVDAVLGRMEADLDGAIDTLSGCLSRLGAP
ncbi:MAG: plasmid mobilization protein [Xanthobacteraceae bacterium]